MKQLHEYKYFVAQVLLDAPLLAFLHTQYKSAVHKSWPQQLLRDSEWFAFMWLEGHRYKTCGFQITKTWDRTCFYTEVQVYNDNINLWGENINGMSSRKTQKLH